MKYYDNIKPGQFANLFEQIPLNPTEIFDNICLQSKAMLIHVDNSMWGQILDPSSYAPQRAEYNSSYYEPLLLPPTQRYLDKSDTHGASRTDHDWVKRINDATDYARACFGRGLLQKTGQFNYQTISFMHHNPKAKSELTKNESYDFQNSLIDNILYENHQNNVNQNLNQLNESIWGFLGGLLGGTAAASAIYLKNGDGGGVDVGSVNDDASHSGNNTVTQADRKTVNNLSIHRQIQQYVSNILTAYRNCVESIIGKAPADKLLMAARNIAEANTMCQKYLGGFFSQKNELIKDSYTGRLGAQANKLKDINSTYKAFIDKFFEGDKINNRTATPNNLRTAFNNLNNEINQYEKNFGLMSDYADVTDTTGKIANVNSTSSVNVNGKKIEIPEKDLKNCYDNIMQIINDKVLESVDSTPITDWKLVVDASTYMHKEAENVDKEIKNKINIICNVNDTNQKANFGSFGGKLRSAIPYKAEGLRTLWGQKYNTLLQLLNDRIDRDIINGQPIQYLANVLKVTVPSLLSIMITYRFLYDQIEKATDNIKITDIDGFSETLTTYNRLQNQFNQNVQHYTENIINYVSGLGNDNVNNSNNTAQANMWFEIFTKYGKLMTPYQYTIQIPPANPSVGPTTQTQTRYYLSNDQMQFFNHFYQNISGSQINYAYVLYVLFTNIFYNELDFSPIDKDAVDGFHELLTNEDINQWTPYGHPQNLQTELILMLNLLKQATGIIEKFSYQNGNNLPETFWSFTMNRLLTDQNLQSALMQANIQTSSLDDLKWQKYKLFENNEVEEDTDVDDVTQYVKNKVEDSVENNTSDTSQVNTQNDNQSTEDTTPNQEAVHDASKPEEKQIDTIKNLQEVYKATKHSGTIGVYLLLSLLQSYNKHGEYTNAINALDVNYNPQDVNIDVAKEELNHFIAVITGDEKEEKENTKSKDNSKTPTTSTPPKPTAEPTTAPVENSGVVYFFKNNEILLND